MIINPRPGFVALEVCELTERSKSGLFVPNKSQAFKVIATGVESLPVGTVVALGGSEKITKIELLGRTVVIAAETSIQATITEGA